MKNVYYIYIYMLIHLYLFIIVVFIYMLYNNIVCKYKYNKLPLKIFLS